jgi:hypothetical protein
MKKKTLASIIAASAAVAFVSAPLTSSIALANHHEKVKCYGVNACKGKSKCKTANNACKGQNACKGKGFVMKTEKKCEKANGTTEEPKASEEGKSS